MECHENVLKAGLKKLSRLKENYFEFCEKYTNIETYSIENVQQIMKELSNLLLNPDFTLDICECFSQIFLEILYETIPLGIDFSKKSFKTYRQHALNCILLGKLILIHPDVLKFSLQYFEENPAPFDEAHFDNLENNSPVPAKKRRNEHAEESTCNYTDLDIVHCCYQFLKYATTFVREKWDWSKFIQKYLFKYGVEFTITKWLALQCIGIFTGMPAEALEEFTRDQLPDHTKLLVEYEQYCDKQCNKISYDKFSNFSNKKYDSTFLNKISKYVTSVSGILIPILNKQSIQKSHIVEVESTKRNLKKIALATVANKAICLSGPVGSGKTALVEHLVAITGRTIGDTFIKVQLGDQTDSKMLLGTYRCTDIPGEFIWQPGVLTQAIMNGNWILLEDINSASMDVVTVLSALLENNTLSVPGFRDSIHISPGFQLFLTQRLTTSASGSHKQSTHSTIFIEKKVLNVNVEPLTQSELIEIVRTLFPKLSTIANRIVDVYLLFSSGMHPRNDTTDISQTTEILQNYGRLISTRDFMKFCTRDVIDFDVSSQESALKVFQDAIDIFCCSLPTTEMRLIQACKVSEHLGIVHTKAEYFCNEYKPSVSLERRGIDSSSITAGRVSLEFKTNDLNFRSTSEKFSFTRPSACLLERIACSVKNKEPVLLVGETGVGKTSSVQYLANVLQQKLIVINMNQQSDSSDLLGGYKPVDLKFVMAPIRHEFETLFRDYFDVGANAAFLENISKCFNSNWYSTLLKLMTHSQSAAVNNLRIDLAKPENKKRKHTDSKSKTISVKKKFLKRWLNIGVKLNKLETQLKVQNSIAFAFVEGSLVKALENGYWVLLDEINLASAETLECLSGLLEGSNGSINLLERGDKTMLKRNSNFTLFACMNPATDVGKKELPAGLRNRFTEFFVEELTDKSDLILLVNTYLNNFALPQNKIEAIVKCYIKIRELAEKTLTDGTGHKPHFSLRTFCRALSVASRNPCTLLRSLYEAFCLSFLTQLDSKSHPLVESLISTAIFGDERTKKSILKQEIPKPKDNSDYVQFEGYWVTKGNLVSEIPSDYILTKSVRKNLHDLVRIVSIGKLPVLLQGDTSVGKTSLITYLAKSSGNRCLRINNHEHTDLQEYIGSYVADAEGKLVFREGILVEAMRKGHWIILDELNLAPSDVLEALNRVLDDNRELYIPETQETIKAHQNFMLFATQNPPGLYGGRKVLSRAFRNRFVELHFDDIPSTELEIIMEERCKIPASYSRKVVQIMTDLQLRRRNSAAFAGKQGFMTLRDLFRWGERYRLAIVPGGFYDWDQHLADEGYLLLAGKVRNENERKEIAEVIKKRMKKDVDENNLFTLHENTSLVTRSILEMFETHSSQFPNIVWTFNMRKLAVMVSKALQFKEPVLLVGNTGGGKTTICQVLAEINKQKLYTVNCHLHTESADFVGGLRPIRNRSDDATDQNRLFEWVDGPLIQAMKDGSLFLADEISLADDSVLERLNSLLEPERTLLLAEKGADLEEDNVVTADVKFNFVSTMNPGGDFGKKELSPALKNRFTEIWCDTVKIREDLIQIINHNISNSQFGFEITVGDAMMDFIEYFEFTAIGKRTTVSIRDILTWVKFINICLSKKISLTNAYYHGLQLTFLDALGSGVTSNESQDRLSRFRRVCFDFVNGQLDEAYLPLIDVNYYAHAEATICDDVFGIKPFFIPLGSSRVKENCGFTFTAPSTIQNSLRLLRAMQLNKAILLEGSPGVGKTSLVKALADASGHNLLRINLSDQTDVSDLFGSDLPVEGGQGGEFCWRDGPFLRALKNGDWIVLDELNLASQSVLEGLNACLDHRGEIYIPELGKTFQIKHETRLFACQNPLNEGGSRKGLPQSFLNRFIQVYISPFKFEDLEHIALRQYLDIPLQSIRNMITFNEEIVKEITELHSFGLLGGPWEFNLRDIQRWCDGLLKLKNEKTEFSHGKKWKESTISNEDRDKADLLIQDLTKKRSLDRDAKIREVKRLLVAQASDDREEELSDDTSEEKAFSNGDDLFKEPLDESFHDETDSASVENLNTSMQETSPSSLNDLESCMHSVLNPSRLLKLLYVDRMRTDEDKSVILSIYNNLFGSEFPHTMNPPLFYITNEYLYLGDVKYHRVHKNLKLKNTNINIDVNVLKYDSNFEQLVLRTQYHVLKSLLLCVKFKWMAILVGPTGTGKSSVVKTLASLTGHELQTLSVNSSMDTTEILGGFEQVDYNRHLEEVSQKTYRQLLTVVQDCLLYHKDDMEFVIDLFEKWEKYKKLSKNNDEVKTMSEETDLFITKLNELKNLIETFPKYIKDLKNEYEYLLNRIEWLQTRVEKEGNLNAGGKFEWIDSTLVKCLRDGTWLLIDNVNLCSPAVLDRLNGVLEPDGSLIIGERGVDENDELINIKPHPNFRLFLTMDPKYGEISRAMRNRGVEIYLLPSQDLSTSAISRNDIRSLLLEVCIENEYLQDLLILIHRIFEETTMGEKPNITQLIHAGFLISQQIRRGLSLVDSVTSVTNDIYIQSKVFSEPIEKIREKASTLIISKCDEIEKKTIVPNLNFNNLSLHSIQNNPQFDLVKQQTALIANCLYLIANFDIATVIPSDKKPELMSYVTYLLITYFQMTDLNSLDLRENYFTFILNQCESTYLTNKYSKIVTSICQKLQKMIIYNKGEVQKLPMDIRWLPEIAQYFYRKPCQIINFSNPILFVIHYQIENEHHFDKASSEEKTILEYAKELKHTQEDPIRNPVINHLLKMIELFNDIAHKMGYNHWSEISNQDYPELIMAIQWYFRFIQTTHAPVYTMFNQRLIPHTGNIDQVTMHYLWFVHNCLPTLIRLFTSEMYECEQFKQLISIIQKVNATRCILGSPLTRVSKHFKLRTLAPSPYTNMEQVENFNLYNAYETRTQLKHENLRACTSNRTKFNNYQSLISHESTQNAMRHLSAFRYTMVVLKDITDVTDVVSAHDKIDERKLSIDTKLMTKLKIVPILHQFLQIMVHSNLRFINEDFIHLKNLELHNFIRSTTNFTSFIEHVNVPASLYCNWNAFSKLLMTPNDAVKYSTNILQPLLISLYEYLDNSPCRFPHNFMRDENNSHVMKTIYPHSPNFVYLVTNLLMDVTPTNRILEFSRLKDNSSQLENLDLLLKLLWNNSCSILTYDNILNAAYLTRRNFILLLKSLTRSLGHESPMAITNFCSIRAHIDLCLDRLLEIKEDRSDSSTIGNTEITNICNFLQKCITSYIRSFYKSFHDLKTLLVDDLFPPPQTEKDCNRMCNRLISMYSMLNVGIGYTKAILSSQLLLVDPAILYKLRCQYYVDDRALFEQLCRAQSHQLNVLHSDNFKHDLYYEFQQNLKKIDSKLDTIGDLEYIRPKDVKYDDLRQIVTNYIEQLNLVLPISKTLYFFTSKYIDEASLVETGQVSESDVQTNIRAARSWLCSQDRYFDQLNKFTTYPDVVYPIKTSCLEIRNGITTQISVLEKLMMEVQENFDGLELNEQLISLVAFPVYGFMEVDHEAFLEIIPTVLHESLLDQRIAVLETARLLLFSLQDYWNYLCWQPKMPNNDSWDRFTVILKHIVALWKEKEKEKRELKATEESLYKTIEHKHLTENEQTELDFKNTFPSYYEKDFHDIDNQSKLDRQQQQPTNSTPEVVITTGSEHSHILKDNETDFIYTIHTSIVRYFTGSEWLHVQSQNFKPDFIKSLLQRYKTYTVLQNKLITGMNYVTDKKLLTSYTFLVYVVKQLEACEDPTVFKSMDLNRFEHVERCFNFYQDEYVEAAKNCIVIIEPLKREVNKALEANPEHPALISIVKIIERIENFEITSPISRFLTGFELLLEKCNEWSRFARKSENLSTSTETITRWIIDMRKFELSQWGNSLNNILHKVELRGKCYWWRLYEIVDDFTRGKKGETCDEATDSDKVLISTLKFFMERSPIGEFNIRLNLIYAFHCQTILMSSTERAGRIKHILWNVYQYYNQFSEIVKLRIKEIRKPIEKELKGFIKIAQWNDINYWSVKETVEKTHRTLHKFMRKFEDGLNELVCKKCLVDDTTITSSDSSRTLGRAASTPTINPKVFISSLFLIKNHHTAYLEVGLSENLPKNTVWKTDIITNFTKYSTHSMQMSKKIMESRKYSKSTQMLNDFITDIIERSSALRKLDVNQTLSKAKQKSDAKNILQQKRKALSDLFKSLTTIGISYKTGLLESNLHDIDATYFQAKPIDLEAAFKNLDPFECDKNLVSIWKDCEKYYVKSVARFEHLQTVMKTPSPQLGALNLERIRGFSTHLLITIQKQKTNIIESSRSLYYLRTHMMEFNNVFNNPYFDILRDSQVSKYLYETFITITHFTKQVQEFFKAATIRTDMNIDTNIQSTIPEPTSSRYNKIIESIAYILKVSHITLDYLDKADMLAPTTEYDYEFEEFLTEETLIEISMELDDIVEFMNPVNDAVYEEHAPIHPLHLELKNCLQDIQIKQIIIDEYLVRIRQIKNPSKSNQRAPITFKAKVSDSAQSYLTKLEEFVHNMLLSIQKLFIKYCSKMESTGRSKQEKDDDDELVDLEDNMLKVKLLDELNNDLNKLNIDKLMTFIRELLQDFKQLTDDDDWQQCAESFKLILPLVKQIMVLYQYFITQQIATYRASCKLSSTLLSIFTELSIKGFCTPEGLDTEDDNDPDGGGEGTGSGMGLTEGTGEKDVSDRIESEDQLDTAKREEDYENQKPDDEKTKEQEGGIEMSEDFEGNLEDVDKDPEEQSDKDEQDDEDADKQMGETEPDAEELDTKLWGDQDDDDDDNGDENDLDGKQGDGEDSGEADGEGKDNQGKSQGDKEFGAKDDDSFENDTEDGQKPNDTEEREKTKEINEMNEPEFDEDQINPYHGKHDPLPEPEDFDMPEEMQLDDGEERQDADVDEENPFDIDKMKENMPEDQNEEQTDENTTGPSEENRTIETDEENVDEEESGGEEIKLQLEEEDPTDEKPEETTDGKVDEQEEKGEENPLPEDIESQGGKPSNEENIEAVKDDTKKPTSHDKVEQTVGDDSKNKQTEDDVTKNDNAKDKDGVGQAQNEESSTSGHQSNMDTKQENKLPTEEKERQIEKRQKPGDTDCDRSLGNTSEPIKKKLKVMELEKEKDSGLTIGDEEDESKESKPKESDAEHFQHVKESKKHDAQVLDAATKEQFEKQNVPNDDEEGYDDDIDSDQLDESSDVEMLDDSVDSINEDLLPPDKLLPEKTESKKNKEKKTDNKGDQLDQNMETEVDIEGETIETFNVARGTETTYHTKFDVPSTSSMYDNKKLSLREECELRTELQKKLSNWVRPPTDMDAHNTWQSYLTLTSTLAHDLCEQLRIILEPTQISRLKGDYRTGRRINMRKVIPYIASQFRKDKIWLRRTRPSKREYQIVLAIDDSQSMADNQSKELAFESLSLLSSALTLLESGQLSVLCFGEDVDVLHRLDDQFSDQSGAAILQNFKFTQRKTDVAKLVNFTCDMFKQCERNTTCTNAKLLIIVSDGRGVYSEGEEKILNAVRRAKHEHIFIVFVILDNPENKDSILDIRMPVFKDGKILEIKTYLERFPFSFYIILRDIKQLPTVLSDALRQWFELVTEST